MGKNNNKPVHKSQMGGGGGGGAELDEESKPFHSKEYEQAQLEKLLKPVERPTWDEFKEQQRKKGEMDGAEARAEEEAQRRFRAELDQARDARLNKAEAAAAADGEGKKKKSHKHKHKHKKDKDKDSHKEKKKKRRRGSGSSDSDEASDSESDEERKKKKKKSHHKSDKKDKGSKADGPVSLRAFFAAGSSDED